MHQSINMVQFIAGWLCGMVTTIPGIRYIWRGNPKPSDANAEPITQEEIRRISDYVRLVIETDSTGST